MNQDSEHLRLLSIFHYVIAGLAALFSFFPLFYVGIGSLFIFLAHQPAKPGDSPPPEAVGWFLIAFGTLWALFSFAFALFIFLAGRALAKRRRYWFAFVIACIECIFLPFGTILGVFTIIVLSRESAKQLFEPSPVQT
jgi:hypothetical protein